MSTDQFDPAPTAPAPDEPGGYNAPVIAEFRSNEGRVGGPFEGAPLILLTTSGARSGAVRTVPTMYVPHENDAILVFGTNGGAPTHPAWYHNVQVHPHVTVERGTETYEAVATPLPQDSEERDRIFAQVAAALPPIADYQSKTERKIPVVVIERRS
ncbi:hypothetical protein SUDANB171_01645 [Streptomyces sp. enrichment culture]|jgi:deazaflavin-dependent oxidoreductase (nitroreductase family)|uniref:nitroreductase family deazaflavin-dependent oxidoreductase n=1 Tax=Streptomyces xiamenensis TaxID=408015 RepID=UPI0036E8DABA